MDDIGRAKYSWEECVNYVTISSHDGAIEDSARAWGDAVASVEDLASDIAGLGKRITGDVWEGKPAEAVRELLRLVVSALQATAAAQRYPRDRLPDIAYTLRAAIANMPIPRAFADEIRSRQQIFRREGWAPGFRRSEFSPEVETPGHRPSLIQHLKEGWARERLTWLLKEYEKYSASFPEFGGVALPEFGAKEIADDAAIRRDAAALSSNVPPTLPPTGKENEEPFVPFASSAGPGLPAGVDVPNPPDFDVPEVAGWTPPEWDQAAGAGVTGGLSGFGAGAAGGGGTGPVGPPLSGAGPVAGAGRLPAASGPVGGVAGMGGMGVIPPMLGGLGGAPGDNRAAGLREKLVETDSPFDNDMDAPWRVLGS